MLQSIRALDRVLKGDATRPGSIRGDSIDVPIAGLSIVVAALGALYGACMGVFALTVRWGTPSRADAYYQMLASTAKVPMLFGLTLLVTLPSLYVFNALVGSRLGFAAVSRLMLAALAVIMAVLASFGTILVFFSLCTDSYSFIVLLNVAMFAVAGLLGMRFLLQTLHRLSVAKVIEQANATQVRATPPDVAPPVDADPSKPPAAIATDALEGHAFTPQVRRVFRVWIILFGLVGAQMGWVLRPFIGNPGTPFTFFREREGNFFQAVTAKVGDAVGWKHGGSHDRSNNRTGYEDRDNRRPPNPSTARPSDAR